MSVAAAEHCFVVPAFGEPAWIERCLDSIQQQTHPTGVVITTSTPTERLSSIAKQRGVPLVVNAVAHGIAADWNFALSNARGTWVSLAHQDDWYDRRYVELCLAAAARVRNAILVFTHATETIDGDSGEVFNARMKRAIARAAFVGAPSIESPWRRRLLLAFGNPIPCPSVMINRSRVPEFRFPEGWKSNLDWSAWLSLAAAPGAFVRVPQSLVHRTLHPQAETTRSLADRAAEDDRMFRQLWPRPIAAALSRIYAASRRPYLEFER